jgi:hypothetical protein
MRLESFSLTPIPDTWIDAPVFCHLALEDPLFAPDGRIAQRFLVKFPSVTELAWANLDETKARGHSTRVRRKGRGARRRESKGPHPKIMLMMPPEYTLSKSAERERYGQRETTRARGG